MVQNISVSKTGFLLLFLGSMEDWIGIPKISMHLEKHWKEQIFKKEALEINMSNSLYISY